MNFSHAIVLSIQHNDLFDPIHFMKLVLSWHQNKRKTIEKKKTIRLVQK